MINKEIKKKLARNWFKLFQNIICNDVERLENNKIKFQSKTWLKNKVKDEPLLIVRNKMNQVLKPEIVKEDTLSPNPIGTTEYKFIDENPKFAWSDINVSQHPEYYKSNFTDELTNTGGFFDNDDDNSYHDRTSSRSNTFLVILIINHQ